MGNPSKVIRFNRIPSSANELKQMVDFTDPYNVCACGVLAFALLAKNKEEGYEAFDLLNGPKDISAYDKSFLKDRVNGKEYVPMSYFDGATPDNNYTPRSYSIEVSENPYSRNQEGYLKLFLKSGGADSPRGITLRLKPSTGEWFLSEYSGMLLDIRIPKNADPWA